MVHVYYCSYSHHYEYDYLGLTVIYETVNLPVGWHLCSKVRFVYPSLRDAFVVRLVYLIFRDALCPDACYGEIALLRSCKKRSTAM